MSQSTLAEFFFTAPPAVVHLQMIEIYHPNFSPTDNTFRFCRNSGKDIMVLHEDSEEPLLYTYLPMQIKPLGTTNSLDQSLEVTLGDVGQIITQEIRRIAAANGFQTKPILRYREYRSDGQEEITVGEDWTFDGTNDRVDIGDIPSMSPTATTPFSVSAWYTGTDGGSIFSKMQMSPFARGWTIYCITNKLYGGLFSDDTPDVGLQGVGTTIINDGSRHHCLMTYDGSATLAGLKLYVDNVLQTMSSPVDALTGADDVQTTATVQIGARQDIENLAGIIEHCSYWDKVLDSGERSELFNAGTPPNLLSVSMASDLVSWYKIDGTDTTSSGGVIDHSGNDFHGTALNGLGTAGGEAIVAYDSPIFGPFELEVNSLSFNKTGCVFTAKPPALNKGRTGEVYDVGRFPMLRGFV